MEFYRMIESFPIGEKAQNGEEMMAKIAIISFLARTQEQFDSINDLDQRENTVKEFLARAINADVERVPNINLAEKTLRLSPGFIQDIGKVQYIKENSQLYTYSFDLIASNLELTSNRGR